MTEEERHLLNHWCSHGCPEKMIIHTKDKTYFLLEGAQIDEKAYKGLNKINNLQPEVSVPDTLVPLSVLTTCLYCREPFKAQRKSAKFCSPRHRKLYFLEARGRRMFEKAEGMLGVSPL